MPKTWRFLTAPWNRLKTTIDFYIGGNSDVWPPGHFIYVSNFMILCTCIARFITKLLLKNDRTSPLIFLNNIFRWWVPSKIRFSVFHYCPDHCHLQLACIPSHCTRSVIFSHQIMLLSWDNYTAFQKVAKCHAICARKKQKVYIENLQRKTFVCN